MDWLTTLQMCRASSSVPILSIAMSPRTFSTASTDSTSPRMFQSMARYLLQTILALVNPFTRNILRAPKASRYGIAAGFIIVGRVQNLAQLAHRNLPGDVTCRHFNDELTARQFFVAASGVKSNISPGPFPEVCFV
ncbi:hypothetical protein Hypma_003787 [Hypsizygus marmoreus]|uniref:Uncharacterized protein n=1 Tax=Hypsizygus marmoreus TaxID=39966 RepID=A0A369K471_HYPMA|nr:hypothetical protein Hypma_003787 [Hypsizygus marmoreus]